MRHILHQDWTCEIHRVALEIQHKAAMLAIPCQENDIHVFADGETAYVLGNPCVGELEILDDAGDPTGETVKQYNIRGEYAPGMLPRFEGNMLIVSVPRIVILVPELCFRLQDGKVVSGDDFHSGEVCAGLQEQLGGEARESWCMTADRAFSVLTKGDRVSYHPHYITDGQYVIKDEGYGHILCNVSFVDDELSAEQRMDVLNAVTKLITDKRLENYLSACESSLATGVL